MSEFKPGSVVVLNKDKFEPYYGGTEEQKLKWWGSLGYGREKPHLFVYLCPILDADGTDSGHCVLVSLEDQHIETMRHPQDFRLATDEEF
jgi:hypothetical protein